MSDDIYGKLTRVNMFQTGVFTLHAGGESNWKIDCDALNKEELRAIAQQISLCLPMSTYGKIIGIPRGGLGIAAALFELLYYPNSSRTLIVDDVWTTGKSMRTYRESYPDADGAVIFARNKPDPWVLPLFVQSAPRWLVTDSCGCVFCDLDCPSTLVGPNQYQHNHNGTYYPCTKL